MAVSVTGIVVNIALLVGIIIVVLYGFYWNGQLHRCETAQSPFCLYVQCPCGDYTKPPCYGYAQRPGPKEGQWYCSNSYLAVVDDNGRPVSQ